MTAPQWSPEQKQGCGVLLILLGVLIVVPLIFVLWRLALLGWCPP